MTDAIKQQEANVKQELYDSNSVWLVATRSPKGYITVGGSNTKQQSEDFIRNYVLKDTTYDGFALLRLDTTYIQWQDVT